MHLSIDNLTSMGVSAENAARYVDRLNEVLPKYGIDTPERVAHFLAQICHESIRMKAVEENLNYSAEGLRKIFPKYFTAEMAREFARKPEQIANRTYGGRLGNDAPGDGWKYRGRGLIQLTGKGNYREFNNFLRDGGSTDDVVANPDLVASKYAVDCAVWYWTKRGINAAADRDDVRAVTKAINGGYNGLDDRIGLLAKAKKALAGASSWSGGGSRPTAPEVRRTGKAPDDLVDAAFAAGWAAGDKNYWKRLPGESGEWADFWKACYKAAAEVDRSVKPSEPWIDAAFAAGWAQGDRNYWKRLDAANPEWSDFWRAFAAAVD